MKKKLEYGVTRNKPLPRPRRQGNYNGPKVKYPFATMKVGDSFPLKDGDDAHTIRAAGYSYGKRNEMRFVIRRDDKKALCCWRVE